MTFGRGKGRVNFGFRGRGISRNNYQREERKSPNPRGWRNQSLNSKGHNNNQASKRYEKLNVQCYYCKKFGHFANECHKKQADMGKHNVNFSESNSETLFITCNAAQESSNDSWFLDSGYNNHMTRNKEIFESLDRSIKS